ncbi:phosphonate metabolism protein/1,5-bisphosphokinase (PRPP-forming) PhnN [Paracoccus methylarcula]|uniref:Ribose 1,5-bisphosphate phosphokinase PhnN n=1 Tax=Paracoccus methylarcula TaxID=72022 RepID=A0A422QWW7_9RHOB|nr:phosphonate metabolism protein/1,5-bisphosphokinase (PRPP-forming) PhnN [Paracoccus methylarcula]RNF34430.1 phosphonate metabolism protein/1,5-bisphosphokinase (PRPP-forming) PhnN [Paracoccus methylarcula]
MTARIVAVVGPSGAGKDTLMRCAAERRPDLRLVRRVITRPAESGGEDFDGVSSAEFERMRGEGRFALDWQAHGLSYGVPHVAGGGVWLVNLSRTVLPRAANVFPGLAVIHVSAASEVLAARLAGRGRESATQIDARIRREAGFHPGALPVTYIDNSGDLGEAAAAFVAALDEVLIP